MSITTVSSTRDARMDSRSTTTSTTNSLGSRASFTAYVIEDDVVKRTSLLETVVAMKLRAMGLDCAESFLATYDGRPGILVCDIVLPGMSGLELQQALRDRQLFVPVVIVTDTPCVRYVVEAVKNGASAVLERSCDPEDLYQSLREAVRAYEEGHELHDARVAARTRYGSLNPQEQAVLKLMMDSQTNKMIAKQLGVSVRTVEARRRRILDKMNAQSIVELVRQVDLVSGPVR